MRELVVVLWTWLRWPVIVLMLMLVVALLYYVAPDVEQEFRFITPGSVLAVLVWILASVAFGVYVQNFADYNATYGSIGAIIVLLLYLYISAAVLLFGAELNAVIEHASVEARIRATSRWMAELPSGAPLRTTLLRDGHLFHYRIIPQGLRSGSSKRRPVRRRPGSATGPNGEVSCISRT